MILEARHLRVILAIADHGTISRAAGSVHLTQSAVSHLLIDLERRIGAPLFLRTRKRMVPTQLGMTVVTSARRVVDELTHIEVELFKVATPASRRLRIGTDIAPALCWLPGAIAGLRESLPCLRIEGAPELSPDAVDALLRRRIDLAVVQDHPEDPRFQVTALFDEELVALVGEGHRLAGRAALVEGDLQGEQLLVHGPDAVQHRPLAPLLDARGLLPARLTALPFTEAIVGFAESGQAIGLVPRWTLQHQVQSHRVRLIPLTANGLFRSWQALTLVTGVPRLHCQAFAAVVSRMMHPAPGRSASTHRAGGDELPPQPQPAAQAHRRGA